MFDGWRTFHSLQLSLNRRFSNGVSFGLNDTIVLYDKSIAGARVQHAADGSWSYRDDQQQANELLAAAIPQKQIFKGNFVWDLPDVHASGTPMKVVGLIVNDWQLSGVWTGATGSAYTVTYSYSSGGGAVNITGSPDYAGRVRLVGDPGAGCSSDEFRQFNAAAFQGPNYNSVGLESSNDYVRGCFTSALDLAIARNIRLGGSRNLQLRVEMFNIFNNTNLVPFTYTNTFTGTGALVSSLGTPTGGTVNTSRQIQLGVRFLF